VRGDGLLLGLKCRVPVARAVAAMRDQKLLTVGAGDNVVRFLPALVVSDAEIDEAVARVEAAAHALEGGYGLGEKGAAA
jgi:acetylornithine/N-succinyldiaminopimelate aminotransferase